MTTTLKRINPDSSTVLVDGKSVGVVSKGWSRTGGQGWTYSNMLTGTDEISTMLTCPTRKAAVTQLVHRIAHGTTNDVNYRKRIAYQNRTTDN